MTIREARSRAQCVTLALLFTLSGCGENSPFGPDLLTGQWSSLESFTTTDGTVTASILLSIDPGGASGAGFLGAATFEVTDLTISSDGAVSFYIDRRALGGFLFIGVVQQDGSLMSGHLSGETRLEVLSNDPRYQLSAASVTFVR
jgi:hypothetical protein